VPRQLATPPRSRAPLLLTGLLTGASLSACAAIWGFQDSFPDAGPDGAGDGRGGDGGPGDGTVGDGHHDGPRHSDGKAEAMPDTFMAPEVSADAPAPTDAAVTDPCSPPAPETWALYVSAHFGNDDGGTAGCGTLEQPCATIQEGLKNAVANGKMVVNVAEGTYDEEVTLQPGLTVVGGWLEGVGAKWAFDPTPANPGIVKAKTGSTTVTASSLASPTTLCHLTIESKDTADPGETLYGVFATGSTTLTLTNVVVTAAAGGNGAPSTNGKPGAPGSSAGCATAGSGAMGSPVAPGSNGDAGTFTDAGYQPGNGGNGEPGAAGQNGTPGGSGAQIMCVVGCALASCLLPMKTTETASPGLSGCGGDGGGPGTGGGGGGSSVGVFAWGGATVTMDESPVTTSAGGNGAPGGDGGNGGPGSPGVQGMNGAACDTKCVKVGTLTCNPSGKTFPAGGDAGGSGGSGGSGGPGGGGSGGFSCPVVQGGGAKVVLDASTLMAGSPGTGANGAPNGNGAASGVCSF